MISHIFFFFFLLRITIYISEIYTAWHLIILWNKSKKKFLTSGLLSTLNLAFRYLSILLVGREGKIKKQIESARCMRDNEV